MDIKRIAADTAAKYKTTNPFQIAKEAHIILKYELLGSIMGYHNYDSRFHFIHLNQELTEQDAFFTCAHELGHVFLHPNVNTSFLRRNTLFSIGKLEREASTFAVELLLPDAELIENYATSLYDLARIAGIPSELVELKKAPIGKF